MADLFVSYARPNVAMASRIADELQMAGYSVWYDHDLPAHRAYADVIEEQLAAAAAVVVLWSTDSVASQWVRSEANRARETGRLVQVRLDDCALPMPFDQVQCADLRKWRGDPGAPGWRTVQASVAALVGGEPGMSSRRGARLALTVVSCLPEELHLPLPDRLVVNDAAAAAVGRSRTAAPEGDGCPSGQ